MEKHEIMTVQEVAEYLRVSERTVYDWATNGTIPCGKLGTTWRFKRSEVQAWVDENLSTSKKVSFVPISIKEILKPEHVVVMDQAGKNDAILEMIEVLCQTGALDNKAIVSEGIFQREKLMSTGIGLGIGIPHVRLEGVDSLIMAVGLSRQPICDYESLDDQPVQLLFMIIAGRHQHAMHVKTMAAISARVKNPVLREMLIQADDADAIYELLTREGLAA